VRSVQFHRTSVYAVCPSCSEKGRCLDGIAGALSSFIVVRLSVLASIVQGAAGAPAPFRTAGPTAFVRPFLLAARSRSTYSASAVAAPGIRFISPVNGARDGGFQITVTVSEPLRVVVLALTLNAVCNCDQGVNFGSQPCWVTLAPSATFIRPSVSSDTSAQVTRASLVR
jgi:hypothetical protein